MDSNLHRMERRPNNPAIHGAMSLRSSVPLAGNSRGLAAGSILYTLWFGLENQAAEPEWNVDAEVQNLKLVLEAARAEAAEWNLHQVQLWDPSPLVAEWVAKTGIPHRAEERTEESLGCLRWYGSSGGEDSVEWVYNEKYAWC